MLPPQGRSRESKLRRSRLCPPSARPRGALRRGAGLGLNSCQRGWRCAAEEAAVKPGCQVGMGILMESTSLRVRRGGAEFCLANLCGSGVNGPCHISEVLSGCRISVNKCSRRCSSLNQTHCSLRSLNSKYTFHKHINTYI